MNVVLVGYGRMGKLLEEILLSRGHRVVCRVDATGLGDEIELSASLLENADGVIEFALAEGIEGRLELYESSGLPVVIGTTGWDDKVDLGRELYRKSRAAILRGSNFSIGAHLFFRLTAEAARLANSFDEYDVSVLEYHHNRKADYPSGTAITAAEGILANLDRKKRIMKDLPDGPVDPADLQVAAVRVGSVPGIHEMRMDSAADTVIVRHEARNRGGFALGAVRGLEWLKGRQGWCEADEFIDDLLSGR